MILLEMATVILSSPSLHNMKNPNMKIPFPFLFLCITKSFDSPIGHSSYYLAAVWIFIRNICKIIDNFLFDSMFNTWIFQTIIFLNLIPFVLMIIDELKYCTDSWNIFLIKYYYHWANRWSHFYLIILKAGNLILEW